MTKKFLTLIGLCAFTLTACMVGPKVEPPTVSDLPNAFAQAKNAKASSLFSQQAVNLTWWQQFHDDTLNQLMAKALAQNYAVQIAQANLQQARALSLEAELNLLPQVNARAGYTHQMRSQAALNNRAFVPRTLSLYSAGFDASWEIDFFGRTQRGLQLAENTVESLNASLRDVQVSLLAEMASNYLQLRGMQAQLNLAKQAVEVQEKRLALVAVNVHYGRGSALEQAQMQAQLKMAQAGLPDLQNAIQASIHRLSVLTGQMPDKLTSMLSSAQLPPALPAVVKLGNPAELLKRRPDVRMAELALASSIEKVGIATADLYPRISFVGSIALEGSSLKGWVAPGSESYNLGPRLSWAFLDLGKVIARLRSADVATQGYHAQFQETVLSALEETENALSLYRQLQQRTDLLAQAMQANEKTWQLMQTRQDIGTANLSQVLESKARWLELAAQHAQHQTLLANALIAVYKALGGADLAN